MKTLLILFILILSVSTVSGYKQVNEKTLNETLDFYFEENLYSDRYKDEIKGLVEGKVDEGFMDQQAWLTQTFLPQYDIILNLTQQTEESKQKIVTLEDRIKRQKDRMDTKDLVIEAQARVNKRLGQIVGLCVILMILMLLYEMDAFQTLKQGFGGMKERKGL